MGSPEGRLAAVYPLELQHRGMNRTVEFYGEIFKETTTAQDRRDSKVRTKTSHRFNAFGSNQNLNPMEVHHARRSAPAADYAFQRFRDALFDFPYAERLTQVRVEHAGWGTGINDRLKPAGCCMLVD